MSQRTWAAMWSVLVLLSAIVQAQAADALCASCPSAGDPLIFYVDDGAPPFNPNLTWLYYANDITKPVPQIGDARDLIRNFRSLCGETGEDLDRNVVVYIREGTYAPDTNNMGFPIPLRFESQDSGSGMKGTTITYKAYDLGPSGAEGVLVSGGIVLDGWTTLSPAGGDRWWTRKLPNGWATVDYLDPTKPRDLYVNNARATRAREPDVSDSPSTQGFARVTAPIFNVPHTGVTNNVNKTANEYALDVDYLFPANAGTAARGYTPDRGIECVMRNQGAWASHRQYVREILPEHTASGRTYVRLHDMIGVQDEEGTSDRALGQHVYNDDPDSCGYATEIYLENAKEFMDEPYEWWFNPGDSGDIDPSYADDRMWVILPADQVPPYASPPPPLNPGDPPPAITAEIVVPYASELFQFHGCSNIKLELLNFAHTNQDLPGPIPYSQVAFGSRVTKVIDLGGGSYTFEVVSKPNPPDPAIEGDLDYPKQGWSETMRGLPFYAAGTSKCKIADQNSIDNLEEVNRYRLVPAVRITGGTDVTVKQCRVAHTGSTGILIENGHGHTIENNEFFDIGGSAVVICRANLRTHNCGTTGSMFDGITAVPTSFTVSHNYIYDTGRTYLSSPAIFSGWTATNTVPPVTFSQISLNYIMNTPSEAIFSGFGPDDSQLRAQTRHLDIKDNIVRNANQLLDDMAGIVTMRDGDGSGVIRNVVFQDSGSTGNAKHGLYTDGKSVFGMTGTPIGPPSGWTYDQNVVWGFTRPFHMNTAHTCPEHNNWTDNFIENSDARWLVCATCNNPPTTPCTVTILGEFDRICDNGGSIRLPYFDFDFFQNRYQISPGLSDVATRSPAAQLVIDGAGPGPSGVGTPAEFLYLTFESLIHPPGATNRTPPAP
ncbi:MAG: right-handed parallel beta-helix repeat-containing protein [Phycisphaera sp.]|nr:MAG: right-handed parallel beta-helix repeat-containing protein [Phycisphaera sp.]